MVVLKKMLKTFPYLLNFGPGVLQNTIIVYCFKFAGLKEIYKNLKLEPM